MSLDETIARSDLSHGRVITRYRLLEYVGRGGMGEVWKAEDLRLKRTVALKFLTHWGDTSSQARVRFQIEAQAAAALEHPAICGIYDIDDSDGLTFLSMPFIEGESLDERLSHGPLPVVEAVQIACQVTAGLEAAHRKNIVHRDIKSSNLMIARDGQVKILDFGIARVAWNQRITGIDTALGTPAYMSPEQIRGVDADHRTDLWSTGIVIYEMLTGETPFQADTKEVLFRLILNQPIRDLTSPLEAIPREIESIVRKALAKSPEERYQNATAMRKELAAAIGQRDSTAKQQSSSRVTHSAGLFQSTPLSIAVLPFANLSSDPESEYFGDGLTDELINALAQVEGIRVVCRTSAFATKKIVQDIRQIGKLLNVDCVLEGSVRKAGNRVRISVQLVRASEGYELWSQIYDRQLEDVFAIQEEIARHVAQVLNVKLFGRETRPLFENRLTDRIQAYTYYLQGTYHLRQMTPTSMELALNYFQRALAEDPEYAPAHAGLAAYYYQLGFYNLVPPKDALSMALKSVVKAIELDSTFGEARRIMGGVLVNLDWDWNAAEREFRQGIELAPGDANIRYSYMLLLVKLQRFKEAHDQLQTALRFDPVALYLKTALAGLHYYEGNYSAALDAVHEALKLDSNYFEAYGILGLTHIERGELQAAVAAFQKARDLSGGHPLSLAFLAYALAVAGSITESRELLAQLLKLSETMYVSPGYVSIIYIGLEEHDNAFEWLSRAYEARDPLLAFMRVLHSFNPLRQDERFTLLLKKVGLESRASARV